jgi:tetratricopeptide (TPR) repeat protein
VAFSGSQSVECPLTLEHAFFIDTLEAASRESVARGGTALADAIRFSLAQVFDDVMRGRRTLVLLTDGGDPDPEAVAAAREAAVRGISFIAIGVGDEREGALVPASAGGAAPLLYQGQPVRTRLNSATLRAMGGDAFMDAGTFDPSGVYRRWIAPASPSQRPPESDDLGWLVCIAVAVALLAIEPRIPERRQRIAAALLLSILFHPREILAQTVEEWFGKGMEALKSGRAQDAMHYFGDTSRWAPDVPEIRFNLGKALYDYKAFHEAAVTFDAATQLSHDRGFQARSRLGQGNALFRESETLEASRPLQAIELLEQCISVYREALRLDPRVMHAAYNLQVAQRRVEDLRDRAFARPQDAQHQAESPREVLDRAPKVAPAEGRVAASASSERDW